MANPFYIPPAESGVSRAIDFGTKLQQLKLMGEDQALRGRAQNLAEKKHVQLYGTPGVLLPGAKELIDDFMSNPYKYLQAGGTLDNPFVNVSTPILGNYQQNHLQPTLPTDPWGNEDIGGD